MGDMAPARGFLRQEEVEGVVEVMLDSTAPFLAGKTY